MQYRDSQISRPLSRARHGSERGEVKTSTLVRAWLGLTVAALALAVPTVASAGPGNGRGNDVLDVGKDVKVKKPKKGELPQAPAPAAAVAEAADEFESPPVGSTKIWPLINFVTGGLRVETFPLRAVSSRTRARALSETSVTSMCVTPAYRRSALPGGQHMTSTQE